MGAKVTYVIFVAFGSESSTKRVTLYGTWERKYVGTIPVTIGN